MRIVVVEDQKELCNVLAKRISVLDEEYRIVGKAYNGQDGLAMIRLTRPDAVFVDIRMPQLDGLQLMEQLTKEEKLMTRCIMLTAYSDFAYTQRSIRGGAFDYLLKPVSTRMLKEVLQRVAQDRHAHRDSPGGSLMAPDIPEYPLNEAALMELRDFIQRHQITDELVLKVLTIIGAEYMHPITLNSLAERLHVNESHLCRVFAKKAGVNLIPFLNGFRLELARTLMDHTDLKIGEIARMTGFGNSTYFGRLFRKHTRLSASEYKRQSSGSPEHLL